MTHRLYLELLFVGLVFLLIMLINNLFLYKQKLKDKISFMLIAGIATNVFEIIWSIFENNEGFWMITITYVAISCYVISFLIFAILSTPTTTFGLSSSTPKMMKPPCVFANDE